MKHDDKAAGAVASPCNNVCRMDDASGWCLGCWRTIGEIASWAASTDDERRAVLRALPARRQQAQALREALRSTASSS